MHSTASRFSRECSSTFGTLKHFSVGLKSNYCGIAPVYRAIPTSRNDGGCSSRGTGSCWFQKRYREFEFLSLRRAVCSAEKTARNSCEIARIGRNCASLSRKAGRRKCPAQYATQALQPFSPDRQ